MWDGAALSVVVALAGDGEARAGTSRSLCPTGGRQGTGSCKRAPCCPTLLFWCFGRAEGGQRGATTVRSPGEGDRRTQSRQVDAPGRSPGEHVQRGAASGSLLTHHVELMPLSRRHGPRDQLGGGGAPVRHYPCASSPAKPLPAKSRACEARYDDCTGRQQRLRPWRCRPSLLDGAHPSSGAVHWQVGQVGALPTGRSPSILVPDLNAETGSSGSVSAVCMRHAAQSKPLRRVVVVQDCRGNPKLGPGQVVISSALLGRPKSAHTSYTWGTWYAPPNHRGTGRTTQRGDTGGTGRGHSWQVRPRVRPDWHRQPCSAGECSPIRLINRRTRMGEHPPARHGGAGAAGLAPGSRQHELATQPLPGTRTRGDHPQQPPSDRGVRNDSLHVAAAALQPSRVHCTTTTYCL